MVTKLAGRTLTLNAVDGCHLIAVTAVTGRQLELERTGIKFNLKFTAAKLSLQPELSPASEFIRKLFIFSLFAWVCRRVPNQLESVSTVLLNTI